MVPLLLMACKFIAIPKAGKIPPITVNTCSGVPAKPPMTCLTGPAPKYAASIAGITENRNIVICGGHTCRKSMRLRLPSSAALSAM